MCVVGALRLGSQRTIEQLGLVFADCEPEDGLACGCTRLYVNVGLSFQGSNGILVNKQKYEEVPVAGPHQEARMMPLDKLVGAVLGHCIAFQ